jgi:hypothetical protein
MAYFMLDFDGAMGVVNAGGMQDFVGTSYGINYIQALDITVTGDGSKGYIFLVRWGNQSGYIFGNDLNSAMNEALLYFGDVSIKGITFFAQNFGSPF